MGCRDERIAGATAGLPSSARIALAALVALIAAAAAPGQESANSKNRLATEWGEIRFTSRGLALHCDAAKLPAHGTVRIPRLNNPVAAVYMEGDESKSPLKLTPHVAEWEIALPPVAELKESLVVIVETVGEPRIAAEPHFNRPSASGVVTLAAHDAVTHGENLRDEPQPHKNTVGYWLRPEDWCAWHFVAPPGRYEIQILQGCGQGQGGSEVALSVGDQEIVFTVEETGHFQSFKNRTLGTIDLAAGGEHTLELRPRTKEAAAVMDVRQVRLIPLNTAP